MVEITHATSRATCLHDHASSAFARICFWRILSGDGAVNVECNDTIAFALRLPGPQISLFSAGCNEAPPTLLSQEKISEHLPSLNAAERLAVATTPSAMLQFAPLLRISGAHLVGAIQLAHVHHAAGAAMLRLHARTVGNGNVAHGRACTFDRQLQQLGFVLPEVHSSAFAFDSRLDDEAFELPAFLLSLGSSGGRHFHTTIGAALLLALAGPILPGADMQANDVEDLKIAIAHSIQTSGDSARAEIEQGFSAAGALLSNFLKHIRARLDLEAKHGPESQVLEVLKKIGTCPHGYHKRGRMAGHPIDSFFVPENFSPATVLRALARSPYVVPGAPEKSRLLTELTQPDGPMYRVFSDNDLVAFGNWIAGLPPTRNVPLDEFVIVDCPIPAIPPDIPRSSLPKRVRRRTLRELYHRLIDPSLQDEDRHAAYAYARTWLARHSVRLDRGRAPIPFSRYSHSALRDWLKRQHTAQVSGYQPLEGGPEETREEVIHATLQLAPMTLIDGAWLRAFVKPAWVTTRIGATLYRIYTDELGNGDTQLHHGNIYGDLLRSMEHVLPAFTTREFAENPIFEDSAFRVPVFWLSVSLFPRDFLPEILGMNVAMELSGVGGEYRRSGEVLAHYGFSPQFTELHNSIDNVATGHTAWAIDAVQAYLDEVQMRGDAGQVDAHWRRVWTGYRALLPPAWHTRIAAALSRLIP